MVQYQKKFNIIISYKNQHIIHIILFFFIIWLKKKKKKPVLINKEKKKKTIWLKRKKKKKKNTLKDIETIASLGYRRKKEEGTTLSTQTQWRGRGRFGVFPLTLLLSFSPKITPNWGDKILVGLERKIPRPHQDLSNFPPQLNNPKSPFLSPIFYPPCFHPNQMDPKSIQESLSSVPGWRKTFHQNDTWDIVSLPSKKKKLLLVTTGCILWRTCWTVLLSIWRLNLFLPFLSFLNCNFIASLSMLLNIFMSHNWWL